MSITKVYQLPTAALPTDLIPLAEWARRRGCARITIYRDLDRDPHHPKPIRFRDTGTAPMYFRLGECEAYLARRAAISAARDAERRAAKADHKPARIDAARTHPLAPSKPVEPDAASAPGPGISRRG